MNKIIFDKNEQKEIVEMYLNYIPINQITQKYGVSKQPIYNVLKENNVKLHGEKKKLNDNQVTDIINMYQNGHTQQEIADMYGVNRWTIKNELKSHGIQLKNRGENIRKYIEYFTKVAVTGQNIDTAESAKARKIIAPLKKATSILALGFKPAALIRELSTGV